MNHPVKKDALPIVKRKLINHKTFAPLAKKVARSFEEEEAYVHNLVKKQTDQKVTKLPEEIVNILNNTGRNISVPSNVPSPNQEGWAERFDERFIDDEYEMDGIKITCIRSGISTASVDEIKSFIRQELTTLHKADCERFRVMIGEDEKGILMKANGKITNPFYEIRNQLRAELRTALSKMEEETS